MDPTARTVGDEMISESYDIDPNSILAVIPVLNNERQIEACIRSLMAGDKRLRLIPLVVVDGGSTDQTVFAAERLKREFTNLTVIENSSPLQSAALNMAVRKAARDTSTWLVRCDADSKYPENFILEVAQSLKATGAESLTVARDAVGETCLEKANGWITNTVIGSGGSAHRSGHPSGYTDHGHHAGLTLEDFDQLGGYDESFSHNEDSEYDARLAARGGRIFFDADIRIEYVPYGTLPRTAQQHFRHGFGRAKNAHKNKTPLKMRQMLPVLVFLASLFGLLIAPVFAPALFIPLGYLSVLVAASIYVTLRHRSACGLLSGAALGTMHMSWATGFLRFHIDRLLGVRGSGGAHRILPRFSNAGGVISNLGRSVFDVVARVTGRQIGYGKIRAANENYKILRPVTRVTSMPENECAYAIGDIHGRFDLLESLLAKIEADAESLPEGTTVKIVFLGDYIDRGLQSRQIVDLFLSDRLEKFETVYLMGNHEEALLNFLQDPSFGKKWAMYGGGETLFSYGLQPPQRHMGHDSSAAGRDAWVTLWNQFRATLPDEHLSFYQSLKLSHSIGDYVFVHAGLRPGIEIDQQRGEDLLWIREEFLAASGTFDKLVVHGHTPTDRVYRDNRRIGLDTGAYMTGRLTAARFYQKDIEYIST